MEEEHSNRRGASDAPSQPQNVPCPGCGGSDYDTRARYAWAPGPRMECRIVTRGAVLAQVVAGGLIAVWMIGGLVAAAADSPGVYNVLWNVLGALIGLATSVHGVSTLASGKVAIHLCRQCGRRWMTA